MFTCNYIQTRTYPAVDVVTVCRLPLPLEMTDPAKCRTACRLKLTAKVLQKQRKRKRTVILLTVICID